MISLRVLSNNLITAGALALTLAGCRFNPSGQGGEGNDAGVDGPLAPDASPDASIDAGMQIPGSSFVPNFLRPSEGLVLPPTRAYLLWQPGDVPSGRTLIGHELCRTEGDPSAIDDENECPNAALIVANQAVVNPLSPNTGYFLKLRARYDQDYYSEWSAVRVFSTDDSLVGWWRMDNTPNDSSTAMNHGTLQNGASFGPGLVLQALQLDGANDHMTVADQPAFDFGSTDFALSAWMLTQDTGGNQAVIEKRDGINGYLLYRRAGGALRFHGDQCGFIEAGNLPHGTWKHVAARRNAGTVRLYIDGTEVGSGTCAENFTNAALLTFGCNTPTNGCTEALKGTLDDVQMLGATAPEVIANEFCSGQALAGVDPLPAPCQP